MWARRGSWISLTPVPLPPSLPPPPPFWPAQATGYGGTVIEGKAVEDKIRRREEYPDAAVEAAAAARDITIYFNSDVAGGRGAEGRGGVVTVRWWCGDGGAGMKGREMAGLKGEGDGRQGGGAHRWCFASGLAASAEPRRHRCASLVPHSPHPCPPRACCACCAVQTACPGSLCPRSAACGCTRGSPPSRSTPRTTRATRR